MCANQSTGRESGHWCPALKALVAVDLQVYADSVGLIKRAQQSLFYG